MKLTVNGEEQSWKEAATLADLMESLGFDATAGGVAVAVNEAVVPRASWRKKVLADGDRVEIIHAVQGG